MMAKDALNYKMEIHLGPLGYVQDLSGDFLEAGTQNWAHGQIRVCFLLSVGKMAQCVTKGNAVCLKPGEVSREAVL